MRHPGLDPVERRPHVQTAERGVARLELHCFLGRAHEGSNALRRCGREAEVRLRRAVRDDRDPHALNAAAPTPAWGRRGRERVVIQLAYALLVGTNHLVSHVVAVLLRVEDAPALIALPRVRLVLAEDPVKRRVAVRDVEAGELVVAVVLAEPARNGR